MSILDAHREALAQIARRSRTRSLIQRAGHDFASNDYLGLSRSAELRAAVAAAIDRGVAIGAGGSRLLRGNEPVLLLGLRGEQRDLLHPARRARPDRPRFADPRQRA